MPELLGVTGFQCSGKNAVAEILHVAHGFEVITSSDVIRDYISANELGDPTRPLMASVAKQLREDDPATIIRASLETCLTNRVVVSGLYSRAEAEYFVEEAGGMIIKCDANQELRYQRALSRARIGDVIDLETFKAWEAVESSPANSSHQSVIEVGKLAVATILNEGSYDNLRQHVMDTLLGLGINPNV